MIPTIEDDTPKAALDEAIKAVNARLAALGGGGYAGLGFQLRAIAACGFEDKGPPNPVKKRAAYRKAIVLLNALGADGTAEDFLAAAQRPGDAATGSG